MPINEEQFNRLGIQERRLMLEVNKYLVGGIITGGIFDHEDNYVGFKVKNGGKVYSCWVLMDPEGNGTGWLQIEEDEEEEQTRQ